MLGRGGDGDCLRSDAAVVHRATVALKILASDLKQGDGFDERFRREAQAQALLDHPHIVTVFEAGESEEGLFIAMRSWSGDSP